MSRLVPTPALTTHVEDDPWAFDPPAGPRFVVLRDRASRDDRVFDPAHPVAADYQSRLERVNEVNACYAITCRRYGPYPGVLADRRTRLRPVHYAVFTDDFDHHGRLYTGRYGHQSLRTAERRTIRFDGSPSVEVDFRGMHPRLLYHLDGIDYRWDPYKLWGAATTPAQRVMAKCLVNALINAADDKAAVSACNAKMNTRTGRAGWKRGKAADRARQLREAQRQCGLGFADLVPLVRRVHRRIARHFGQDVGMDRLMRVDAAVALDVLSWFADRGRPCLGVHDSFVVPAAAKGDLIRVARRCYRRHVGFWPMLKG